MQAWRRSLGSGSPQVTAPTTSLPDLVFELRAVQLRYGEHVVLEGVDLEVPRGDLLAVLGPNGSGKTTLLRAMLGTLAPARGACVRRGRVGYAPQRGALDPVFPFTTREVVAMGLLGGPRRAREDERAAVTRALEACGLLAKADAPFRDLSGGQRQRALVARALVSEPDVLVLDEPTNDLDLRGEHEVMELVRGLHAAGRTVVFVSHALHVVARYARRIAFLSGRTVSSGPADEMLAAPRLAALYGLDVVVGEVGGRRVVAPALAPEAGA